MSGRSLLMAGVLVSIARFATADDTKLSAPAEPATATAVEAVGAWADADRIAIEGAYTFTADKIRRVIQTDIDCQVAGNVTAPLAPYPDLIAARVRTGYQFAGFARAAVTARLNRATSQLILSIDEGARFTCGEVHIEGNHNVDAEQLRAWLMAKHPRSGSRLIGFEKVDGKSQPRWIASNGGPAKYDEPAWHVGELVCVDERSVAELKQSIARGLAHQGYRAANFDTALPLDDSRKSASLFITIRDHGPRAFIDRIDVTGSERDTAEEVCQYLDVKVGDVFTDFDQARLSCKLCSSGRYLRSHVEAVTSENPARPVSLRIKLQDYDRATPLREPLSAAEEALLTCREWVLTAAERGDDLTIRVVSPKLEMAAVYSAAQGLMLHLNTSLAKETIKNGALVPEQLFVAKPGEILYLHEPWDKRFQAAFPTQTQIIVNMHSRANSERAPDGTQFCLFFGMGMGYKESRTDQLPVLLAIDLLPSSILSLAHERNAQCQIDDGVLTITWPERDGRIRIEAATGRLLELGIAADKSGESRLEISIAPGAFAKRWQEIAKRLPRPLAELPNDYDANRPVSSLLAHALKSPLVDLGLQWYDAEKDRRQKLLASCDSLAKLAVGGALAPLDDLVRESFKRPDPPSTCFSIPEARWHVATFNDMLAVVGMFYNDRMFPHGSWAWRLWREVTFQKSGRVQTAKDDFDALRYSNQLGPLGRLAASYLTAANSDMATTLEISGLERLDVADFATDYLPLLERGKLAGDLLCQIAAVLRDLDDGSISIVDTMFGDGDKQLLLTAAQTLRRRRGEKIEDVLPAVLDQLWTDGLREIVEQQLRAAFTHHYAIAQRPPIVYPTTTLPESDKPEPIELQPKSPARVFSDPK